MPRVKRKKQPEGPYLRPVEIRERVVQQCVIRELEERGGMARKLSWEARVGAPDLQLFIPDGRVFFVECKALDAQPRPSQKAEHKRMSEFGHFVHIVDSPKAVQELMARIYI